MSVEGTAPKKIIPVEIQVKVQKLIDKFNREKFGDVKSKGNKIERVSPVQCQAVRNEKW